MPAETEPPPTSLADPVLPIDPEHAARLLGEALRRHHEPESGANADRVGSTGTVWSLATVTEHLAHRASTAPEVDMPAGPYQGRTVLEAVELASSLVGDPSVGAADDDPVPIRPGIGLEHCLVVPGGALSLADPVDTTVVGDRHLDLAAAATGLHRRFGAAVVAPMIEAYGFDRIDLRRLDLAQLLVAIAVGVGWPRPGEGVGDG